MSDLPARSKRAGTPSAWHRQSLATLSWDTSTCGLVHGSLLETCLLKVTQLLSNSLHNFIKQSVCAVGMQRLLVNRAREKGRELISQGFLLNGNN